MLYTFLRITYIFLTYALIHFSISYEIIQSNKYFDFGKLYIYYVTTSYSVTMEFE